MALQKGFLRPGKIIYKYSLYPGIAVGLIFSFGLYGFFYFIREAIRIGTGEFSGSLIILSPKENFYYNLFYGTVAAVIGFSVTVRFVFENSINYTSTKLKLRQRHILNENDFNRWTFLYAFAEITSVFGIWYLTVPMEYDINFLADFSVLLILIPLVLFLNIWPVIIKTLGRKGYKWMAYSFVYVAILSLGFANLNFINIDEVNLQLKDPLRLMTDQIKVPETTSYSRIYRSSLAIDIYILNDSISSLPIILWGDSRSKIKLEDILNYINWERSKITEYERGRLIANLHIDKNVKIKVLSDLRYELRKVDFRQIQYSTGIKNSKYPSSYPLFKDVGIKQVLFPHYPELEVFLDSAENLDYDKYTIRIPDNPMYRVQDVRNYNRVEIKSDSENTYLNGKIISDYKLTKFLYKFIKKHSPNFVVIYSPDESISYGRYIQHLDMFYSTIDKLRNEMSMELYDKPFYEWYSGDEFYEIKDKYPLHFLEWTLEEKRLLQLLNKKERSNTIIP